MPHSSLDAYTKEHPELQRVFEFPAINTTNSATYVDGHVPESRKQALDVEKKIANLTAIEYGTKPSERGRVREEIKELKSRRKAPIGTNKGTKKEQ